MSETKGILVIDFSDPIATAEMLERSVTEEVESTVSDIKDPIRRQEVAEVVRRDFERRYRMI